MPVRIYDIAKKLEIPNKVVLEKAKELGIAAHVPSCTLDKITAEYLMQQLAKLKPKPEMAPVKTKPKKTKTDNVAEKATQKTLDEAPTKLVEEKVTVAPETHTAPSAPAASVASIPPVEKIPPVDKITIVPKTSAAPASAPVASQNSQDVPESVIKEVEQFVQQGLEELAAEGDEKESSRNKNSHLPGKESVPFAKSVKKIPAERSTSQSSTPSPKPSTQQPIANQHTKAANVQSPSVPSSKEPEKQPQATLPPKGSVVTSTPSVANKPKESVQPREKQIQQRKPAEGSKQPAPTEKKTAPAPSVPAAKTPAKPPVFGLKQMWKIPLSVIGKRLAEGKNPTEPPSAEKTPEKTVAEKPTEETKLGQKVGFIQLPQKPAPVQKQQGQGRDKEQKRDRSGRDKDRRSAQQGRSQQGNSNAGGQQKKFPFQQKSGGQQQGQRQQSFNRGQNRFQQGGKFQQSRGKDFSKQDDNNRGKKDAINRRDKEKENRFQQPIASVSRDVPIKIPEGARTITMKAPVVVRQLAELLDRKPFQLIADLMELGVFANVNQSIDEGIARKLCAKHGCNFELERREKGGALVKGNQKKIEIVDEEDDPSTMVPRPPVVTIMGHVDHGKTTLLDSIRKSHVASGEAGGITQHIGAYTISIPHPERKSEMQKITFLDTPGHEAFSAMRARGANVTDIVILVVAANDGVMPQTIEAIRHAQAAKVTIMVAVNKCDLPGANPMRARQQLQDYGLLCEEWGGNTIFVDVSALIGKGVDTLLGMLVLQAEMLELKANPNRNAKGNVIESGLAAGGPTATVLVRKGTLKQGDSILCGEYYGKARALINEEGKRLKQALPSEAVKLLGLNGVPEAGTEFIVVENEKIARSMAEEQMQRNRAEGAHNTERTVTLEGFLENFNADSAKILKIVVKGDTQGSVEAIVDALKKIESSKVSLEIIHSAVGTITESDVILASASCAVIVGFHTRVDSSAAEAARRDGVQIKLYSIIYELIDQVRDAMAGLLDPIIHEIPLGQAEVRQLFDLSKGGMVAGCMVTQGKIAKGRCRVMRGKEIIFEGSFQSIRHFQDEVSELKAGMECGIRIDGFHEYQVGDIIQSYSIEKVAQQL